MSGCGKTFKSTDELIEKARKEIPISHADTIDMQYAGMCVIDHKAIAWFISGNEYQAHYYLPIEIGVKEKTAEYTFIRTHKAIDERAEDIAYIQVIRKDAYPYVFFYPSDHADVEYAFLDADGNEVK